MTRNAKVRAPSYAGSEPALQQNAPVSLKRLRALRSPFDHARDPLISAQLKAMAMTESQRREESGRGSSMVGKERPAPVLRPKRAQALIRASFDQAWLREQRAAQLARFQTERAARSERSTPAPSRIPARER